MEIKCPECGSKEIERRSSEIVCKGCGLVIEEEMFMSGNVVL
jgi:transcription initiation factor TFIIIB Brf1 subunit/transcription initiation factor TFIIB